MNGQSAHSTVSDHSTAVNPSCTLSSFSCAVVLVPPAWDRGGDMTEQQAYDVLTTYPGFELRRYPEHVVADVWVDASFESAANSAFRPLVGYITGGGVAMTAPVLQETAADVADATSAESYRVSFVMPAGSSVEALPIPNDARVTLRRVAAHDAAAIRFSGRWSRAAFRRQADKLVAAVAEAGLEPAGPLRWARFDPPWTPSFLRRNEIVLPVR